MFSILNDEKKVKVVRLIIISIGILIVIFFTFHLTTYIKLNSSLAQNIENEKKKFVELSNRIDSIEVLIDKIQTDSTFIEKLARENLGMVKKGEKVFKFKKIDPIKSK